MLTYRRWIITRAFSKLLSWISKLETPESDNLIAAEAQ